jgi:hypothetical protein
MARLAKPFKNRSTIHYAKSHYRDWGL